MNPIRPKLIGRFGNQLFIYCYARAYAEQNGLEFRCEPWVGDRIFELDDARPHGDEDMIDGYRQNQESLIYTKRDVQRWFKFRPEIVAMLSGADFSQKVLAHRRLGDYQGYGYVVVSEKSYHDAAYIAGLTIDYFCSEEKPYALHQLAEDIGFAADFYFMCNCAVLFRANSSFSWWAGAIGNARVFAPVIDYLVGGQEHDCAFDEGNFPKFANLQGITDLILPP